MEQRKEYYDGDVVMIDKSYDWTEKKSGKKYFVTYLGTSSVLLADTKRDALAGRGHIYSIGVII